MKILSTSKKNPVKLSTGTYTIKKNEYISLIAAKFSITTKKLTDLNFIKGPDYIIQIGQVLKLPGDVTMSTSKSKVIPARKAP